MNDYAFTVHFEDGTSRAFQYRDQSLHHAMGQCWASLAEATSNVIEITDILRDGAPL